MDALVMAGGRGTRLATDREKPLYRVGGRPMIDRVIDALEESALEGITVATTAETPETHTHVDVPTIETAGEGYVADLDKALAGDRLDQPVLTVAADLPLLTGALVDRVLDTHDAGSLTVAVPADLKRDLGVSVDTTFDHGGRALAPTGVNVVGDGPSATLVERDPRLAINVNRPADAVVANERLQE